MAQPRVTWPWQKRDFSQGCPPVPAHMGLNPLDSADIRAGKEGPLSHTPLALWAGRQGERNEQGPSAAGSPRWHPLPIPAGSSCPAPVPALTPSRAAQEVAREMPQGALGPSPHDLQLARGLLQPLPQQPQSRVSKIIITRVQLPQTRAGAESSGQVPTAGAGQLAISQPAGETQEKEPQGHHSHQDRRNLPPASQRADAHTPGPETLPTLMGSSVWPRAWCWSHHVLQAQPLASSECISSQKGTNGSSQHCLTEGKETTATSCNTGK